MSDTPTPFAPGYFRLTRDVTNPRPDGRRPNRGDSQKVWPKGLLVKVRQPGDGTVGMVEFPDGTYVMFGGNTKRHDFAEQRAGNEIVEHIEPAVETLGVVLREATTGADSVLAMLIEYGIVNLSAIKNVLATLDAMPDDASERPEGTDSPYTALRRKHGLKTYD